MYFPSDAFPFSTGSRSMKSDRFSRNVWLEGHCHRHNRAQSKPRQAATKGNKPAHVSQCPTEGLKVTVSCFATIIVFFFSIGPGRIRVFNSTAGGPNVSATRAERRRIQMVLLRLSISFKAGDGTGLWALWDNESGLAGLFAASLAAVVKGTEHATLSILEPRERARRHTFDGFGLLHQIGSLEVPCRQANIALASVRSRARRPCRGLIRSDNLGG